MTFVILRAIVLPPHERLLIHGFLRAMARTSGTDRRAGLPAATERRLATPTSPPPRPAWYTPPATPLR